MRILVDRLWPRGVSKQTPTGVPWLKEVAPRAELRKWFDHQPSKWAEFQRRYFAELDANPGAVAELRKHLGEDRNTLLYGTREEEHNNAVALREHLLR